TGPWRQAVQHGLLELKRRYQKPDGLYRASLTDSRAVKEETSKLYDQAFVLLALASAYRAGITRDAVLAEAIALVGRLKGALGHPEGGFREHETQAFQSNPHMHLLEAALAWREAAPSPLWTTLSDELAELATARFVDPDGGFVREFFDERWRPVSDQILPGHQFEWAWLLARHDSTHLPLAERLYAAGAAGVDPIRHAAIDELSAALTPVRRTARLWPQTERIRAACLLSTLVPERAEVYRTAAADGCRGLWRYQEDLPQGLYRDTQDAAGAFAHEPAPASSVYHLWGAVAALNEL
ncbi:MAG TPA: AGE family epimerase/isomerase, partial [Caulobacteraceae bacterium]|nr:AGE family epimerase/isomerase [Caulobacteraceae bacterium]